jgi:hypothetical protein
VFLRNAGAGVLGDLAFASNLSLNLAFFNSKARAWRGRVCRGFLSRPASPATTTDLGTLQSPTVSGFFDLFVNFALSTPFCNEFGVTGGGDPAAGERWQIDVPDHWCRTLACQSLGLHFGSPHPNDPLANIIANVLANSLNSHNDVPGNLSNYLNDCGAEANAIIDFRINNIGHFWRDDVLK